MLAGLMPLDPLGEPWARRATVSVLARPSRYDSYGVQGDHADTTFMSELEQTGRPHKQRPGVCHRCGWTGPVSKVGRVDRKRLKAGKSFGRLCDECIDDLLRQQSAGEGTQAHRKARLKVLRHRDVA